jgi:kumamolisin
VTAFGGTQLTIRRDGAYLSERAWSLTGGGYSTIFKRPAWQVNPGIKPSEKMRGIPDAAFDASPYTALRIVYNNVIEPVGGDSATGPAWAAFIALANQVNGKPLGFINPKLYQIGRSPYYHWAFHDVTTGSNGYPAGPNWDPATGLGSPNVYNLVRALTVGFSRSIPRASSAGTR